MKNSIIQFYTLDRFEGLVPEPYPSYKKIPSWFSNTEIISRKSKCPFRFLHGETQNIDKKTNISGCPGVIDFLSTGYVVPAWNNFAFRNDNGRLYVNWEHNFHEKYNLHENKEQISGFNDTEKAKYDGFSKIDSPWYVKTSPGISIMYTHPLWHREKRFTTVTGIMHTDQFPMPIKWFFEWNTEIEDDMSSDILPQEQIVTIGTPLFLIIPFVREKFTSEVKYLEERELSILGHKTSIFSHDWMNNSLYNQFRKGIMKRFL
jgi:hypothetical protein